MTCRLSIVQQDIVHDCMPISMPTTWVVTTCSGIGEEDPDIIGALSHRRRPPAHTGKPTGTRLNGEGREVQDERELMSDRRSSQRVPGAATSPIVACSPDGRGAVYSRRFLSLFKHAALGPQSSPVVSPRRSNVVFLRSPFLSSHFD